jgi:hypothetical protein
MLPCESCQTPSIARASSQTDRLELAKTIALLSFASRSARCESSNSERALLSNYRAFAISVEGSVYRVSVDYVGHENLDAGVAREGAEILVNAETLALVLPKPVDAIHAAVMRVALAYVLQGALPDGVNPDVREWSIQAAVSGEHAGAVVRQRNYVRAILLDSTTLSVKKDKAIEADLQSFPFDSWQKARAMDL